MILKTAFNQSEHNPQFKALEDFSQKLEAATGGKYKLEIHPNELLVISVPPWSWCSPAAIPSWRWSPTPWSRTSTRTSPSSPCPTSMTTRSTSAEVTGDTLSALFSSTKGNGFEALTAYTAGARSMYVKGAPIQTPEDMKGKKIRVMQSDTMVKMLGCMGGTGVPMGQGEVYSAIQQGVLDGAENNEITYADLKQYEAPTPPTPVT